MPPIPAPAYPHVPTQIWGWVMEFTESTVTKHAKGYDEPYTEGSSQYVLKMPGGMDSYQ